MLDVVLFSLIILTMLTMLTSFSSVFTLLSRHLLIYLYLHVCIYTCGPYVFVLHLLDPQNHDGQLCELDKNKQKLKRIGYFSQDQCNLLILNKFACWLPLSVSLSILFYALYVDIHMILCFSFLGV